MEIEKRNNFFIFLLFLYMFGPHVCLCTTFVPNDEGFQRRVSDPLKLKLLTVVGYHVDAGNGTRSSRKVANAHN